MIVCAHIWCSGGIEAQRKSDLYQLVHQRKILNRPNQQKKHSRQYANCNIQVYIQNH